MALPPTVKDDIIAETIIDDIVTLSFINVAKLIAIIAPNAPLIIPQISPITSLQTLDTLTEFLIISKDSLAPFMFLDDFCNRMF